MVTSPEATKQEISGGTSVGALRTAVRADTNWRTLAHTLTVLFKLRIVSLLLLAATGGAFLGAGGWPGGSTLLLVLVAGGLAVAGSSALNQYLERDSDRMVNYPPLRKRGLVGR
ncbi:MAG: hypothetical protein KJ077_02170 [Anaerolineae bacterium]|nr:hypothetical protein [Anaerolineae bacterium]